jgi:hypothetical protein
VRVTPRRLGLEFETVTVDLLAGEAREPASVFVG